VYIPVLVGAMVSIKKRVVPLPGSANTVWLRQAYVTFVVVLARGHDLEFEHISNIRKHTKKFQQTYM